MAVDLTVLVLLAAMDKPATESTDAFRDQPAIHNMEDVIVILKGVELVRLS